MKVRGIGTLGIAQALALAAALGAASAYAAWLTPTQLALWALALAAGRAAMLLIDGGLKAALVRHAQSLQAQASARLTRGVLAAAVALSALAGTVAAWVHQQGLAEGSAAGLVALAVATYLLSHAVALTALARLERAGRFDWVGRVEGGATVLEFALPALLLASGLGWAWALALGLVVGRGARAAGLVWAAWQVAEPERSGLSRPPWRDGLAMQAIAALAMLRDQMHLWLVAPWFGALWAGAYAFALLACALASQVVVATVARVAVPALRPLSPRRRARRASRSLRRLALWTLPLLLLTWPVLHWADAQLWGHQWHRALELLPGLLLRMVTALPLAVLGPWLAVAVPSASAAALHARWTAAEVLLAVAALAWLGPLGLAVSWALGGALGTLLFLHALRPHGAGVFLGSLWRGRHQGRRRWSMSTCS